MPRRATDGLVAHLESVDGDEVTKVKELDRGLPCCHCYYSDRVSRELGRMVTVRR
jgi:hypothetical protein